MTDSIWQTIAATPWWIYPLYAYILWIGLMTTKARVVSVRMLSIAPFFFVFLSMMTLFMMLHTITWAYLSIWIGALFLGTGLGYLHLTVCRIRMDKHSSSLYLPGTWVLFIIFLILFLCKVFFKRPLTFDIQLLMNPKYATFLIFFYGLITGLLIGRLGYALRCLKSGPFLNDNEMVVRASP